MFWKQRHTYTSCTWLVRAWTLVCLDSQKYELHERCGRCCKYCRTERTGALKKSWPSIGKHRLVVSVPLPFLGTTSSLARYCPDHVSYPNIMPRHAKLGPES
ncbi:hypothetical protein B0H12DRAFT_1124022 [Mycena haematopus]|nr:hypothetical protein B0H12DRAFT_1124022 [Mycena haematopus]